MLNTFENYRRHTRRRNERELHLRRIEALSTRYADGESNICSIVDDISGMPLRKNDPVNEGQQWQKSAIAFLLGIIVISSVFGLGIWIGKRGISSVSAPQGDGNQTESLEIQYENLLSLLFESNVTSKAQLEDENSAAARAVQWILSGDTFSNPEITRDRFALAVIYFETRGSNMDRSWTNAEHWLSSCSVCFWYGVDCYNSKNGYGGIRSLNLSSNNLLGSLPAEIGLLHIESLSLYSNSLVGTIPATLGRMTDLSAVYLDNNFLSGTIPTTIGALTNMVDLRIGENMLIGSIPSEISTLRILQIAYFDSNKLSGTLPPEAFGPLFLLHELHLHDNEFTGSVPLEFGKQVLQRVLYLDGNHFTGTIPSTLGNMEHLESLYVFNNGLSGSFPATFERLSNLQHFQAQNNQLSSSVPEWLGLLTDLEILKLQNNSFTGHVPASLGHLTTLTTLQIHGNNLVGTVPALLCELPALHDFTSDCNGQLYCGCCTQCYNA